MWYKRRPGSHRLPRIRVGNLVNDGWADLHGPGIKAANTRAAAGFFEDIAARYLSGGDKYGTHIVQVARSLNQFYTIIYSSERFMTDASIDRLKEVCIVFGGGFMRCRENARKQGELSWRVTPKVHKMQHIPAMCALMNPRFVSCYSEESQIGTTLRVWKRSVSGRYKAAVQRNVLTKRLLGLFLRLEI